MPGRNSTLPATTGTVDQSDRRSLPAPALEPNRNPARPTAPAGAGRRRGQGPRPTVAGRRGGGGAGQFFFGSTLVDAKLGRKSTRKRRWDDDWDASRAEVEKTLVTLEFSCVQARSTTTCSCSRSRTPYADRALHPGRRRYATTSRSTPRRCGRGLGRRILKADLRRRIACRRTLAVLDRIIDGSNPRAPVRRYYPGDDLFTSYERRRGLPIGNLTSQLFSNVYLDRFDHFVTDVPRAPYLRCVDDFALFADDPARLEAWRARAERFLEGRCLSLHPAKTRVAPAAAPAEFLGCVLLPGGRRRLRRPTCGGSATGCAGCATAGAPGRSGGRRWSSASPRGWRTRRTPTRGGCAARSSGTGRRPPVCAACVSATASSARGRRAQKASDSERPRRSRDSRGEMVRRCAAPSAR